MKKVKYCSNSTISEAWVTIKGGPSHYSEDSQNETAAMIQRLKKNYKDLQTSQTIVVHPSIGNLSPSFWNKQVVSQSAGVLARFGHKYLGVHKIVGKDGKYETYDKSFLAIFNDVINCFRDVAIDPEQYQLSSISFGYVNRFNFDSNTFNITDYFKLNVGIEIDGENLLKALKNGYNFFDEKNQSQLIININIGSDPASNSIAASTSFESEKVVSEENLFLTNHESILGIVRSMKEAAKSNFFFFTTEKTHQLMGAVYA